MEQTEWNTLYCILITYQLQLKWNAIVAEVAVEETHRKFYFVEMFSIYIYLSIMFGIYTYLSIMFPCLPALMANELVAALEVPLSNCDLHAIKGKQNKQQHKLLLLCLF